MREGTHKALVGPQNCTAKYPGVVSIHRNTNGDTKKVHVAGECCGWWVFSTQQDLHLCLSMAIHVEEAPNDTYLTYFSYLSYFSSTAKLLKLHPRQAKENSFSAMHKEFLQ